MKEINIGRVLIKNRHKRGITQDELANHLGVSKGAVSKWETGSSLPDILLLPQLASYFDISIDELIGYQPQMEQEDIKELYIRLSKDFSVLSFDEVLSGKEALKELSLTLSTGEVFGFLGPNGAGKTTTVKLLTGVLSPSGGSCEIMGVNPNIQPEKVHLLSGIVTEHAQMYDNLTGIENLMFYATAFGLEQKGKWRAESLLKELELTEAKDQKLATYSTGMRQRLSMARALLHHPKVLFLDEPTSGLDPESAQNVNQMIHNLARKEGITVFLCTHQLRYAQEICTRYGLIDQGILLASGTIDELRARVFTSKSLRICASAVPDKLNFVKCGINEFETKIQDKKEIPYLVRKIVEAGEDIYSVNLIEPTLEDIYFTLTAGRKED